MISGMCARHIETDEIGDTQIQEFLRDQRAINRKLIEDEDKLRLEEQRGIQNWNDT